MTKTDVPKTGKPSAVYKNRIERYPDEVWLIWSNKWGCWYRANSQGYTSDIAQAGRYTREQAAEHMEPLSAPRSYRDTEPFPASAVRAHIRHRRAEAERIYNETIAGLDALDASLAERLAA